MAMSDKVGCVDLKSTPQGRQLRFLAGQVERSVTRASSSMKWPRPSTSSRSESHSLPEEEVAGLAHDRLDAEHRRKRLLDFVGFIDPDELVATGSLSAQIGAFVKDEVGASFLLPQLQPVSRTLEVGVVLVSQGRGLRRPALRRRSATALDQGLVSSARGSDAMAERKSPPAVPRQNGAYRRSAAPARSRRTGWLRAPATRRGGRGAGLWRPGESAMPPARRSTRPGRSAISGGGCSGSRHRAPPARPPPPL